MFLFEFYSQYLRTQHSRGVVWLPGQNCWERWKIGNCGGVCAGQWACTWHIWNMMLGLVTHTGELGRHVHSPSFALLWINLGKPKGGFLWVDVAGGQHAKIQRHWTSLSLSGSDCRMQAFFSATSAAAWGRSAKCYKGKKAKKDLSAAPLMHRSTMIAASNFSFCLLEKIIMGNDNIPSQF